MKKPKNPKTVPDPRSEVLKYLDLVEERIAEGLDSEDRESDTMVQASRAAKRLIESNWTDARLPEWKVRIFWQTTDAIVRAPSAEEARNVALSIGPRPVPTQAVVMKEDAKRAWEHVATFKL